jgi:hypothetical protein
MSDLTKRAEALAAEHPIGEVLENSFLWLITAIGAAFGYLVLAVKWLIFHSYSFLFVVGLAFAAGFKKTSKPAVKPEPAPEERTYAALIEDERIIDQHQTPFGVPFGPNVFASHD